MTSAGYEFNWSIFVLIYIKIHIKLSYRWLEKLIHVYYNKWLKLICVELNNELEKREIDLIDLQYYNKDLESMLELVKEMNQEDHLLDKVGDPSRLSRFITEVIEKEKAYP